MYEWTTLYAHQRIEDMQRESEKQRIINEALAAGGKLDPIYAPALAEVGRRLSELGAQLQERYATQPGECGDGAVA